MSNLREYRNKYFKTEDGEKYYILETDIEQEMSDEIDALRARVEELEKENTKLNKLRTHCPDCGADYAITGLDNGCSCKLLKRIEELEAQIDKTKNILKTPYGVELNIRRGLIVLPDYYIRKTDTNGEYAELQTRIEKLEQGISKIIEDIVYTEELAKRIRTDDILNALQVLLNK